MLAAALTLALAEPLAGQDKSNVDIVGNGK